MPSKVGKKDTTRYYYAVHLKSASLYIPVIWFGVASWPSIATWIIHGRSKVRLTTGYNIILAKLQDRCCK